MTEQPTGGIGDAASLLRDEAVWAEPPADLYDRIATTLEAPATRRTRVWLVRAAAVAAATAAVFGVGVAAGRVGRSDRPSTAGDPPLAEMVMVGTDAAPGARATVEVFDRGAGYALILDTAGLAPAPVGTYYEGWLRAESGEAVSVGTFHMRGGDDTVVLWSGVPVEAFPTLVVTRQDAGDATPGAEVLTGSLTP